MTIAEKSWQKVSFNQDIPGPLDGLVVVDISRLVAGNMTSMQLADFGAQVIKVEPLPNGDGLRAWRNKGVSTFWKVYGRNKKSIALDFRADGAMDILHALFSRADVLIENFRPGTMEKMGLDPKRLVEKYPRLTVLRVSGFGQSGPYSKRPGFGTLVEGMSGFAHRNGEEGGDPLLPPLALADMISGIYGAMAAMISMWSRTASGRGQIIDLSLLDCMVSVLGPEPLDYQVSKAPKLRLGNASNQTSPRNVYRTKDDGYVALSASMQKTAERLFEVIGRADMNSDPRYMTNEERVKRRHEVDEVVSGWMSQYTQKEVLEICEEKGITVAPLYDISDIHLDPHFIERGIYVDVPDEDLGEVTMHNPVPRMSGNPAPMKNPAPQLGEDTMELLQWAGFDSEAIEDFYKRNVVS